MRPRPSTTIIFLLITALGVALAALFFWSLTNRRPIPQYDPGAKANAAAESKSVTVVSH